jgi:hypothetical protein
MKKDFSKANSGNQEASGKLQAGLTLKSKETLNIRD